MAAVAITESRLLATSNGPEVAAILVEPEDAIALMVLGHGAGIPIYRPLMVQMSEALAVQRIATFRYNYPYSESLGTKYSSDMIDPLDVLLSTTSSAMSASEALSLDLPLFLGGRSMSSQIMSLALTREDWPDVRGMVLFVFPMRWRVLLEDTVSHLQRVSVPMLFVQGARDEELPNLQELQPVLDGLGNRASLHVVGGTNHSYDPPVESDRTRLDALSEVASVTAEWMRRQLNLGQSVEAQPPTRDLSTFGSQAGRSLSNGPVTELVSPFSTSESLQTRSLLKRRPRSYQDTIGPMG